MATLTVATVTRAGVSLAGAAAAGGGDAFANTGSEFFVVKNADASPHDVTFISQAVLDGLAVADKTVTVGAGAEMIVGPFPKGVYNDTNDLVQVTYSAVTSVTVKVVKCSAA